MQNEMMNLVTETIREIDRTYRPGTLEWLKKNKPMEWKALLWLETWINKRVQKGQDRELRELLNEYKELVNKANKLHEIQGELFRGINPLASKEIGNYFTKNI